MPSRRSRAKKHTHRRALKNSIHTLTRRVAFLETRIIEMQQQGREAHRDREELAALNYAIALMQEKYDDTAPIEQP